MEIHELNTKALTDPAYVPFDDGTDTYKAEFNEVVEDAANAAVAAADLTNNSVAFTSGDAASPTAWSSVSVITSGSTLATLFNRISTMVKNVRWLYSKLGTTDISSIGGGTVTGAISALNGKLGNIKYVDRKYITSTGTGEYSYTLISAYMYVVFIGTINNTTANTAGIYIITPQTNASNITTLNASNRGTVTVNKLNLTVNITSTYTVFSVLQI